MTTKRHLVAMLFAAALSAESAAPVAAQGSTPLKIAYVPGVGNLSIFVADAKGYFKAEGIEYEALPINTGPGAATAVASKSADIGYGGMLPTIVARAEGIPFKFILGGYYEQEPVFSDSALIASVKSGINSVADLKGKTVAVNNASGINDLQVRLKLKEAGIALDSVKILTIPFPQMQAALEVGNADAVGTVDPFRTSILQKKVGKVIAQGYVQKKDLTRPIPVAGYYATEEWIKGNAETLARLRRAIAKANEFIAANQGEARELLVQRLRFAPQLAASITLPPFSTSVDPAAVQSIIDAAFEVGLLKKPISPQDVLLADTR
ncbi:MAG: ABC transporter substrate-binding protein [Burkholderiaceae bacterium]